MDKIIENRWLVWNNNLTLLVNSTLVTRKLQYYNLIVETRNKHK